MNSPDKLINEGDREAANLYYSKCGSDEQDIIYAFESGIKHAKQTYGTREQGIAECLALLEGDEAFKELPNGRVSFGTIGHTTAAWLREKLKGNG